ncbi:ArsO family NAD(P)H-dependent flavin-containing monooxygenase [Chitinophaga filiformis]|uniref:ArsO family NAD(P)H-dependent flavin-containing monooxygenase n=1 Tax=Chitinophaga filiformis TaxID=104663 RepID=A0ABY4HUM2_CHIFI|nr:ArsO family NAD(P)H-dependent flavin-containing monooxygenase [Chitinophaga filiformis]UPK67491.1 ArsO family NAD(P)H-dependent flavin-containing monooxygenase [Chitinophaga filiformis]
MSQDNVYDVIVIGGGQSALAVAYYLRRTTLRYVLLDKEKEAGGSWQHVWDSLTLFSPAQWSSLPGIIMTGGSDKYPTKNETLQYLRDYESKYQFPVIRPVEVLDVSKENDLFLLSTNQGTYVAKAVISATGSYSHPVIPDITGKALFKGTIIHSADYRGPAAFAGKRVVVAGEGNSGAQILAEVSKVADVLWTTRNTPSFLPDHVDGRYLFDAATALYKARQEGKNYQPPSLGHIVQVPLVRAAIERDVYHALPAFDHFYENGIGWNDGRREAVDAVIFCTGFLPALQHLASLHICQPDGKIRTHETSATDIAGLWLVGYGSWTGFASATLIGVGRTAKKTVDEVQLFLKAPLH